MRRSLRPFPYALLAVAAAGLVSCNSNDTGLSPTPPVTTPSPSPTPVVPDTYVLTSSNRLLGFASATPANVSGVSIAVPAGETLLGGDFRPADGLFYIVTRLGADNSLRVYTLNTTTGALGTAIPLLNNGLGAGGGTAAAAITLAGSKVSVDFNPVANALRIVDSTGVNLRTTLAAGNNTFIDAPLSTGIGEAAYTNTFATTCQTELYYLNASQLLLSAAPNGVVGNLATPRLVGNLGVAADINSGFDVRTSATGTRNVLTAALRVGGTYGLYTINEQTGAATSIGAIGGLGTDTVLSLVTNLPSAAPANAVGNMLAITGGATQNLVTFNRPPQGSPARLCGSTAITGLATGDAIVGADTRPNDGLLYALAKNGNVGTLYTIASTGAATSVATLTADPNDTSTPYTGLDGTAFGVDFNPVPDRLRVVSDTGQNLRMTVAAAAPAGMTPIPAGGVTTDTALTTAANTRTGVTAAGYTNSLFGGNAASLTTTLYAIDSATNVLALIGANPGNGTVGGAGNPNSGVVTDVGALGVDVGDANAFDITGNTGTALLAATLGSNTTLYTVNLTTGVATAAGNFPVSVSSIVAMGSNGAQTATVFGVTPTNKLVSFAPATPDTVAAIGTISVPAGETVQGIDFRPTAGPRNGQLTALTTAADGSARLYAVDPATAVATLLSTLSADPADTAGASPYTATSGAAFGVDFNPLPDRLRTVSDTGENLRSNVDSGATFTDGTLSVLGVYGAGYTNSFTSTAATQLFYLRDVAGGNSELHGTTAPNDGTLTLVGTDLGADYSTVGDLDFAGGQNGFALAALQPQAGGASGLFRINTATGAATSIGSITTVDTEPLVGIAIQLRPSLPPAP